MVAYGVVERPRHTRYSRWRRRCTRKALINRYIKLVTRPEMPRWSGSSGGCGLHPGPAASLTLSGRIWLAGKPMKMPHPAAAARRLADFNA